MLSVALLSLLVPTTATVSLPAAAALAQQDNLPVTIWLNKRNVDLGDRVRAYARTNADGYLVVLHAEPDGRVRVLFPVDPGQDNFVRAGSDYEIHGRGGREAFRVYSSNGLGTVYAAFSRDPFVFEPFSRADHWDYGLPETWIVIEDAEAELTDIAVTMASGAYFDYDYVQYGVGESVAPAPGAVSLSFYGGTYAGLGLGAYYYPDYYSWRRWAMLSYPYYGYYGWGWYDPFHYGYYPYWGWAGYYGWRWPYYWRDPYWYRYGWGSYYGCCYYGGYDGWYYTYSNNHGYSTYSNGRIRYTPQRSPYNAASRTRRVYTAGHTTSPARRVALANGGTASGRGTSSVGRRTSSGTIVRVADTPTRRATSTTIRNAGTSTRRSFPQQPVRTTPVRTSTSDTRSVATAGRRESSLAPSSTRTTGSVTSQSRPVTTRRTTTPARPQVSPVRTTDVRRQVTSTRRTTTSSANRSTTIRRPTSTSIRSTTSRPSTSTPRRVTSAPRTRTTATVRRPSTPTRTPTRVSRPAPSRSSGSVSRSSGSTSSSSASKPNRRKKP